MKKEEFALQFAKRMEQFGEGVFARLAEIKRKKTAEGAAVIDLSVGAPNIAPSEKVMKALADAAMEPKNYVYALRDQQELLQAVRVWYQRRYGVELDPDTEICSLLGSQEGLAHIALSILDAGELTLVPDPCYPVFADGPRIAGSAIYYMPQRKEKNYLIQLADIPEDIARRAKFMVVSYPNNPTCVLAPDSFYRELIAFAQKYDIIILHDNAYSELVFDGKSAGSFLRFPGAKEVGVEFNSLSKTYGLAGARIGFCVGNAKVVSYLKTLKSNMDYGMFLPIQKAAVAAITGDQSSVETTRAAYEKRRDVLCDGLLAAGWQLEKPEATMFVWAPVPAAYSESEAFVLDLVEKAGVLVTPGSAFGPSGEGYVRMALVQDPSVLQQAVEQIAASGLFAAEK